MAFLVGDRDPTTSAERAAHDLGHVAGEPRGVAHRFERLARVHLAAGVVLFPAIERALARDARAREERGHRRELRRRFDALTPREREVLAHVLSGQLNKQIAGDLDTAERTIKAHRANLMAKLQVQSVAELAHLAHEAGFAP